MAFSWTDLVDGDAAHASQLNSVANQVVTDSARVDTHVADEDNPHGVTAAQAGAIPSTEKGAASGVAGLDDTGKVPTVQLPSAALVKPTNIYYPTTWSEFVAVLEAAPVPDHDKYVWCPVSLTIDAATNIEATGCTVMISTITLQVAGDYDITFTSGLDTHPYIEFQKGLYVESTTDTMRTVNVGVTYACNGFFRVFGGDWFVYYVRLTLDNTPNHMMFAYDTRYVLGNMFGGVECRTLASYIGRATHSLSGIMTAADKAALDNHIADTTGNPHNVIPSQITGFAGRGAWCCADRLVNGDKCSDHGDGHGAQCAGKIAGADHRESCDPDKPYGKLQQSAQRYGIAAVRSVCQSGGTQLLRRGDERDPDAAEWETAEVRRNNDRSFVCRGVSGCRYVSGAEHRCKHVGSDGRFVVPDYGMSVLCVRIRR